MSDNAQRGDSSAAPTGYVIDVCMTCGRQAKYPFCEHYPYGEGKPPRGDREPWCMVVRVALPKGERTRLARAMAEAVTSS